MNTTSANPSGNEPTGPGPDANLDPAEVIKFDALAARWWDPDGEFRPLHDLNPTRLHFIQQQMDLRDKKVLDVGCGGGILSESLLHAGARVTGIDAAGKPLTVARLHAAEAGLDIDYRHMTAEELAHSGTNSEAGSFDAITCMELLEHVPDPLSLIEACHSLLKPGGMAFFSTINRTMKAYFLAVVGAEYVMRLLPRGTHDYEKFIRPSELADWARHAGLQLITQAGMHYNPVLRTAELVRSVDVNYLMCFKRPGEDE